MSGDSTAFGIIVVLIILMSTMTLLSQVSQAQENEWPIPEFRGAWVATVANIDWPSSSHLSSFQQKNELIVLLNRLHELNFNAIILQVRTSCDALYNSTFDPWSTYLTGQQGRSPDPYYDPLQFAINEAHARNMELHAWFNPYRARAGSTSKTGLAPSHAVYRFPSYSYPYGKDIWMDPGSKEVMDYTFNVFMDVVNRYDIDGIHIDDYFYPYPVSGHDFPDSATFRVYQQSGGKLDLHSWRRNNINQLIEKLSHKIKASKPYVKFGISPFGIWKPGYPAGIHGFNAFDGLYADSRKWLQEGIVDYMTPQLYWKIDPPGQSYPALLKWWTEQNNHYRHIYTGNYAAGINTHNWPVTEIERQVAISRSLRSNFSLGNIFFSAKYFVHNSHSIGDIFKTSIYNYPSLAPVMEWLNVSWSLPRPRVTSELRNIKWSADDVGAVRSWAIYKREADSWQLISILNRTTLNKTIDMPGQYAVRSVDRLCRQGSAAIITIGDPIGQIFG